MSATASALSLEHPSDRRHKDRIDGTGLLLFCDLGDANGGLVLDISKTGFGLQCVNPLPLDGALTFGIELPGSDLKLGGHAQVVWSKGTRAGLRFGTNCRGVDVFYSELIKSGQALQEKPSGSLRVPTDVLRLPALSDASLISKFLERLVQKTGADGGALAILEDGRLFCRNSVGAAPPIGTEVSSTTGLTGECVQTRSLAYCASTAEDPRVDSAAAARMNVFAAIVLPCQWKDKHGLIELFSSRQGSLFPREVLRHADDLLKTQPVKTFRRIPSPQALPTLSKPDANKIAVDSSSVKDNANEIKNLVVTGAAEVDRSFAEIDGGHSWLAGRVVRHKFQVGGAILLVGLSLLGIRIYGRHRLSLRNVDSSPSPQQTTIAPSVTLPTPVNSVTPARVLSKARPTRDLANTTPNGAPAPKMAIDLASRTVPAIPSATPVATPEPPALALTTSTPAPNELLMAPSASPLPPPVNVSTGYRDGKLLFKVNPTYPAAAAGKSGSVTLQVQVAENGAVTAVKILRSDDPSFSAAAKAAVSRWRYAPSVLDGQPIAAERLITVNFRQ